MALSHLPTSRLARSAKCTFLSTSKFTEIHQSRFFSQSSQQCAYKNMNFSAKNPTGPSITARKRDTNASMMPTDVGILPGTFVRPLWRNLPSVFQNPRDRWQIEWAWIRSSIQNLMSLVMYCKKGNDLPLLLKDRRKIARLLYDDMYTAFAQGDSSGIRRLCCEGLSKDLVNQIESRPKNQKVSWKLVKWLRGPSTYFTGIRVMSDRGTQIHEFPNSGIRQIVLRMTSLQAMSKNTPLAPDAPAKEQNCEEYIVIQELRWNGSSTGWRVWGYTKPTDLNSLHSDPTFAPGLSPLERIDAMKRYMGGWRLVITQSTQLKHPSLPGFTRCKKLYRLLRLYCQRKSNQTVLTLPTGPVVYRLVCVLSLALDLNLLSIFFSDRFCKRV
ncbi:uncharacterized protein N7483_007754 [Penicillium malachiteum]|uniref:uncharacterized protein n=1 Tax=Penicillium malachiteum TaxID=1324776 RepID=UPI0025471CB1|nr:uncharacterized protein N7483_007754 [Penicillium malachiteum]KAJ5726397.1 hypothetical protein N7483_007754 [Penicillium malachiteum]